MNDQLSVREMQNEDIQFITDYWLNSDADYLAGMGADIKKMPPKEGMIDFLRTQIQAPYEEKKSYALIWCLDEKPIGHNNVNGIEFGKSAKMHLHLWNTENRQKGSGTQLVRKAIPFFFKNLKLKELLCEPYALNAAPNKTLEKVGFEFQKRYTTIPGSINFEQEVNQWKLTREQFKNLNHE